MPPDSTPALPPALPPADPPATRGEVAPRLLAWYDRGRRDLPWRVPPGSARGVRPDPYHVLVSEAMLQQTQVATVVPYFRRWIERFPTLQALADADEQDVLRAWQGLGYYARARNLQKAARAIASDHGGRVPSDVAALLDLPGVGRYTAGAVASLAFDTPAPIVDGNVVRVLCRLDRIEADPRTTTVQSRLWARAEQLLPEGRPGDFNSALMELGATVCTPRSPKCLICPVEASCLARAAGAAESIPPPKRVVTTPLVGRTVYAIRRPGDDGSPDAYLIERRPPTGRWAGLWQFVTVGEADPPPVPTTPPVEIGVVTHALTHRRYRFAVRGCDYAGPTPADAERADPPRRWASVAGLDAYPLPKPHLRVAALLGDASRG